MFFVFLLAAFEFGWLNVLRHTADNAAYEAARAAMVPGATAADAKTKANGFLKIVGAREAKVTITPASFHTSTNEVTVAIDVPMSEQRADRAAVHRRRPCCTANRRCGPNGPSKRGGGQLSRKRQTTTRAMAAGSGTAQTPLPLP